MLKKILFSDTQQKILLECKLANNEEIKQWPLKNLLWPIIIIFLPALIHCFIPDQIASGSTLIFNGSLSLLGVNILFGMSSYLIKFKVKRKEITSGDEDVDEEKLNEDVFYLRDRLDTYKNILVTVGAIFYVIQTLYYTYIPTIASIIFILITLVVLYISTYVGRCIFAIRDDFFEKTFYGEYNKPVVDSKDRWSKKFRND